jgi:hypothetical protein
VTGKRRRLPMQASAAVEPVGPVTWRVVAPIAFITPTCRICSVSSAWIMFATSTALSRRVSAPNAPSRKRNVSIWAACG